MKTFKNRSERRRVSFSCEGSPDLAKQSFKDECDINFILRKARDTGLINHVNAAQASMQDLSDAVDYKTSLDLVIAARDSFNAFPAIIRQEFNNNPAEFLEFAQDPKNNDRMIELGLAEKVQEPETIQPKPAKAASQANPDGEPQPSNTTKTGENTNPAQSST